MTNAMKTIRSLQKQWKEIGERYQAELLNPSGSGPQHQQLLRDLVQQISSIKMEIDALQDAIIQHEALAAFKKEQDADKLKTWQAAQDGQAQVPSTTEGAASPDVSPEAAPAPKEVREPGRIVFGTVGSVINTKA